jgi:hypothetical protein
LKTPAKPPVNQPKIQSATTAPKTTTQKPAITPTHPAPKTNSIAKTKPQTKEEKKNIQQAPVITEPLHLPQTNKTPEATVPQPTGERKIPVPKVLLERENNLVSTITTSEEDILVELYDNGTIDNDTITVYLNNEKVINSQQLTLKPLSIRIKGSPGHDHYEIVVVADNLGEIPPNTAMMIIKAGRERHEIFLASNEQRNAKVVINWVPRK